MQSKSLQFLYFTEKVKQGVSCIISKKVLNILSLIDQISFRDSDICLNLFQFVPNYKFSDEQAAAVTDDWPACSVSVTEMRSAQTASRLFVTTANWGAWTLWPSTETVWIFSSTRTAPSLASTAGEQPPLTASKAPIRPRPSMLLRLFLSFHPCRASSTGPARHTTRNQQHHCLDFSEIINCRNIFTGICGLWLFCILQCFRMYRSCSWLQLQTISHMIICNQK